ncbi:acetyl-CoA acetyltransferase [Aeromicrobium sp. A1-2]|uniref:acetyl-CoA acetyltransferase n=1 Tax=Aeromicrobium sp. A1-2 TaxID=2107713 RepID=UPI000E54C237|nr:acetyl-CoA acetyltransferase [Aeromicrobium sp. A1-2]AXT86893.1 acetyl-CoA acetyltransferase [Aeromicrobium sp. A1-2]
MPSLAGLDPRTPVIVGVGQCAEQVNDPDYRGMSAVDLAARAAANALADAAGTGIAAAIDTIAAIRQFEISTPIGHAPLGRSTNVARSIARAIGADPARAILEVTGGQGPQHLVSELGDEIAAGRAEVVLLAGSEAISTARHLAGSEGAPDFSEDPGGTVEDRGYGLRGIVTLPQVRHGLTDATSQYALLEHARRAALGLDREAYAHTMGELFAPFTDVAAVNPLAAAPTSRTADELMTITDRNRMVADPFPRFVIARDQVNQGAAVLMMSVGAARRLGVVEDRWTFVHGRADTAERSIIDRPDLGASPAAVLAVTHALEVAGIGMGDLAHLDLYSCYPIAVSAVCDGLGLAADDPRGLTVTGGLPFFGGAGNNYSMHAIAEIVNRVRRDPGTYGLVGANGGILSKYSAGIYATTPTEWPKVDNAALQQTLDVPESAPSVPAADGWAIIETYTVQHARAGATGIVVGRLDGRRFLATTVAGDDDLVAVLTGAAEPIGARIYARSFGYGNRVTLTPERMDELLPRPATGLREDYEHVAVRRDGHILEVTLQRPQVRNALHAAAHVELDGIFDAYLADPELWVAIITGAGDDAFCAGNDLTATTTEGGGFPWFPSSGFGGLTSREGMHKPVIAAVNGAAMGGGFEIVLACQLAVADESARFALPEVKVGLFAAAGGVVRLPRAIPTKIAHDMILTGRAIPAAEALRLGLVSRVVPDGGALAAARELAAEIVAVSPTSVRLSLEVIEQTRGVADDVAAARKETDAMDQLLVSEDTLEGVMAFAEKRTPQWKNR